MAKCECLAAPDQCLVASAAASKRVGGLATVTSGGTPDRSRPDYWNGSIPWVKTGEFGYIVFTHASECISAEGVQNSAAKVLSAGTMLVAVYGQGVTREKVAPLGIDATVHQAYADIRPIAGELTTKYLFYYCSYTYEYIRSLARGANQLNLNVMLIRSMKIPVPSVKEQESIVFGLAVTDRKLDREQRRKTALDSLFGTLLHDLMTGRDRVTDLDIAEVRA